MVEETHKLTIQPVNNSWLHHFNLKEEDFIDINFILRGNGTKEKSGNFYEGTNVSETYVADEQKTLSEEEKSIEYTDSLCRLQSSWNELLLTPCEYCNLYFHSRAYKHHKKIRHLQPQNSSLSQFHIYTDKILQINRQEFEKKRKSKQVTADSHKKQKLDFIHTSQNEKKRSRCASKKKKQQKKIDPECEENTKGQTENYNEEPENLENLENTHLTEKYSKTKHVTKLDPSNADLEKDKTKSFFSAYTWSTLGLLPEECTQNLIFEPFPEEATPILDESDKRNSSSICLENDKQDNFADDNNSYLNVYDNGSELYNSCFKFPLPEECSQIETFEELSEEITPMLDESEKRNSSAVLVENNGFLRCSVNSSLLPSSCLDLTLQEESTKNEMFEEPPQKATRITEKRNQIISGAIYGENKRQDRSFSDENNDLLKYCVNGSRQPSLNKPKKESLVEQLIAFASQPSYFRIEPIKLSPTKIRQAYAAIVFRESSRKREVRSFWTYRLDINGPKRFRTNFH